MIINNQASHSEKYEEFLHLPRPTEKSDPSWFAFPMTVKDDAPFKRSDITGFLETNKIQTRNYFAGNIMLQPAYTHLVNVSEVMEKFPVSRKVTTDTFFFSDKNKKHFQLIFQRKVTHIFSKKSTCKDSEIEAKFLDFFLLTQKKTNKIYRFFFSTLC